MIKLTISFSGSYGGGINVTFNGYGLNATATKINVCGRDCKIVQVLHENSMLTCKVKSKQNFFLFFKKKSYFRFRRLNMLK